MRLIVRLAAFAAAAATPVAGAAHESLVIGDGARVPIWLAQCAYAAAWFFYEWGAARKRPRSGQRFLFRTAMVVAGLALFGPFDDWAASSTAWHMVQHMLLIIVVAPLAVLARPMAQWRALIGPLGDRAWRPLLRLSRHPSWCMLLHAAAIWIWHAPAPYMAAVLHSGLHVLEHASFLFTGWLFWWSVLRAGRREAPAAAVALLLTAMHTGLLGALLTFANRPLYGGESRELWDQQLAGLVMWIPGGIVYLLAAAWAGYRSMSRRPTASASTA